MSRTETIAHAKQTTPPDFEQTVKAILALFAVFTGFAVSRAVEAVAGRIAIPPEDQSLSSPVYALWNFIGRVADDSYFWALIALLALLLRYLIGSAIHLNDTYVKRVGQPEAPVSRFFAFLFKDLIFLVIFGIVVLLIAKSVTVDKAGGGGSSFDVMGFAFGSMLFLFCGLLWSAIDVAARFVVKDEHPNEWPGIKAYEKWPLLDVTQLGATWILIWGIAPWLGLGERVQVMLLAAIYIVYFFMDIKTLISALQKPRPFEIAVPPVPEVDVTPDVVVAGVEFLQRAHDSNLIVLDARGGPIDAELAYALINAVLRHARTEGGA